MLILEASDSVPWTLRNSFLFNISCALICGGVHRFLGEIGFLLLITLLTTGPSIVKLYMLDTDEPQLYFLIKSCHSVTKMVNQKMHIPSQLGSSVTSCEFYLAIYFF